MVTMLNDSMNSFSMFITENSITEKLCRAPCILIQAMLSSNSCRTRNWLSHKQFFEVLEKSPKNVCARQPLSWPTAVA